MVDTKPHLEMAIEVQGLTVNLGQSLALFDLSFSLPKGHLIGIMGPNGAGKTTLIKALLGIVPKASGSIRFFRHTAASMRKKIAYVPQRAAIDWTFPMTVRNLALMGCYPKRGLFSRLKDEDYLAVEQALVRLDLQKVAEIQIGQLSGGQQQRAFLARALVQNAEVCFFDEPFTGIDVMSEQILMEVLQELRRAGKTILIVHHDLITAKKYFSWGLLLNTALISTGSISEVLSAKNVQMAYGGTIKNIEELVQASPYSEGIIGYVG
jgi:manganese/zinc/iron transport system ATP- binding protein